MTIDVVIVPKNQVTIAEHLAWYLKPENVPIGGEFTREYSATGKIGDTPTHYIAVFGGGLSPGTLDLLNTAKEGNLTTSQMSAINGKTIPQNWTPAEWQVAALAIEIVQHTPVDGENLNVVVEQIAQGKGISQIPQPE